MKWQGVWTALVTPFNQGEVDQASLKKLIRSQLDSGIEGFVVHGTTAESPTTRENEKKAIFDFVKSEVAGAVPLIIGTGTNSTSDTIEASQAAEKWGCDGVLVVVPYYNKPPQRGLFQHYKAVAGAISIPVVLYNVPSRTITSFLPETVRDLSQIKNIVALKEATGDIEYDKKIMQACGPDFSVLSGDDGTFLDLVLAGGTGVISVISHILPKQCVDWCRRARKGDRSVLQEFEKYKKLNDLLFKEANPIAVKMALHHLGILKSPELRLPLVTLENPLMDELKSEIKKTGVIL